MRQNDGLGYLGNGASGNQYYVLRMQGNVARANARNTSEVQGAGSTAINDGQWHHLVAVFAGDADRRIYVDGVLDGSSTVSVTGMELNRFGIGALTRNTPYNPADLYTGLLDEVQLYNIALDAGQIAFLRDNPGAVIPEPAAAVPAALTFVLGFALLGRRRRARANGNVPVE